MTNLSHAVERIKNIERVLESIINSEDQKIIKVLNRPCSKEGSKCLRSHLTSLYGNVTMLLVELDIENSAYHTNPDLTMGLCNKLADKYSICLQEFKDNGGIINPNVIVNKPSKTIVARETLKLHGRNKKESINV
jgi:flagellin-specific chaperone FliS